jgi:hypothetical protein
MASLIAFGLIGLVAALRLPKRVDGRAAVADA